MIAEIIRWQSTNTINREFKTWRNTRIISEPGPRTFIVWFVRDIFIGLKSKGKKIKKKKKCCKHRRYDSSDPYSSEDSDSSNDSSYRRKRCNNKKNWEKDTIRLCASLTVKLLTTAYKSKIIRFKIDEDPLQRRIYFLTFVDMLEMIFSHHT